MTDTKTPRIKIIVSAGFFAAITFLGIQAFRIPVPAAVGTPFLHFGHIFVILSIFCLGPKVSAVSSTLGFIIFDLLNGYVQSIPNVLVTTLLNCFIVGTVYTILNRKTAANSRKGYLYAVLCAIIYGILNILLDFLWGTGELILLGSSISAAAAIKLTSIPATGVNSAFTVAGVLLLYLPVRNAYNRFMRD